MIWEFQLMANIQGLLSWYEKKTPLFSLIHILKLNIQLTKMTVQFFLWFQNIFFYCSRMFSWFCIIQIKHTTFMIYTNMYLFSIGIQSIIQKYIHEKYRFDIIHKMIFFKKKSLRLAKILLLLQFIQKPQFVAWWADISNIQTFKKQQKKLRDKFFFITNIWLKVEIKSFFQRSAFNIV